MAHALTLHPLPEDADRDLLQAFVVEAMELLERVEPQLPRVMAPDAPAEALHALVRDLHTIKGTASFLALPHVVTLAHELETVCGGIQDGRHPRSPQMALLLRKGIDLLAGLMGALMVALDRGEPMVIPAGYRPLLEALLAPPTAPPVSGVPYPVGHAQLPAESFAELTLRIPTPRMDAMVGHIALLSRLHARLAQSHALGEPPDPWIMEQAGVVLQELQEMAQGMRMVPFHGTFRKLGRLARDTATHLGKAVEFHTEGGSVEVDRSVVEQLGDPLLHMVRNAIDHGIESAEERVVAGKPSAGSVRLAATLVADTLTVVLRDDGRGLNRDRLVAEARRRGLVPEGAVLSDAEAFALIFTPGFSTASHLTTLSGRGVGMDVVRERIRSLQGEITIQSTPGVGTTFTIRVPAALREAGGPPADRVFPLPRHAEGHRLAHAG